MYEESKSSIDWKGIILKVIVVFLIVIIAVKGYTMFRGNKSTTNNTTTNTTAESQSSTTFTANIEKLKKAGEEYFKVNTDKLPKNEGTTVMVTLNELVKENKLTNLYDEDGKSCDGESSYVTATLEGKKTKIKANLVCGNASSYSLVYMSESDTNKETSTNISNNSTSNKVTINNTNSNNTTKSTTTKKVETTINNSCSTSSCPNINISTNTKVEQNVNINTNKNTTTKTTTTKKIVANTYTVKFDTNGGRNTIADEKVSEGYIFGKTINNYRGKKTNCEFKGWYLDGVPFDSYEPIKEDITLVAKYTCIYNDNNDFDEEYYYEEPQYYETIVYSIAWFEDGIDKVNVNHSLKVPEELEEDRRITEIKIAHIEYVDAIDTKDKAENHMEYFNDTYMYNFNDWEAEKYNTKYLATIDSARFSYSTKYIDIDDAIDDGFNVTWRSSDISDYCSKTFKVTNGDSYAKGLCNYGISYRVIWQYR